MKKLLLILLCSPIIVLGQLGDYYKPIEHPKAKGLNFQIKIPLGFEQMEADRPNVVQKWIKNPTDNSTMVLFMVIVKDLPVEIQNVSIKEWRQYLKYESGVDDMIAGLGDAAISPKYYVLDNYSGLYYEGLIEQERLDYTFKMYHKTVQVFLDKHLFQIQILSLSKELLEENTKLFLSLGNSVLFTDQYGN